MQSTIREAITITQTSPGLYAVRVSLDGVVMEQTELTHQDAWPAGVDMVCEILEARQ